MTSQGLFSDDSWMLRTLVAMGATGDVHQLRWNEVGRLGLLPVMAECSKREGNPVPEDVLVRHRANLQRKALLRFVTGEVSSLLSQHVPMIVLKGEVLADELYPLPQMRVSSDIDVLVLPGDLEKVEKVLGEAGYRPAEPLRPQLMQTNKEIVLTHERLGVTIDLHWALSLPILPGIPPHELFESRRFRHLKGADEVPVLREDWLLLHLALHFFNHLGFAKGLIDIAAWLDKFGLEGPAGQLLERSRRLGLYKILQWCFPLQY